jgi:hypothetical protein
MNEREDRKIDEAIEMTFPASDPPASGMPTSTEAARRPADRMPPRITRQDIEAAERGEGHRHRVS